MSVVSGKKIIFCEGKQSSLDARLLKRVVQGLPGNRPAIVAAGGKFTFSVFAQGYFFPEEAGEQRYIIFRDRDFDSQPTANIQLLQLGQRMFLTHSACVENYLLDANLIHSYWRAKYLEKQANPSSKWGHGDSPGMETISEWIKASAGILQEYQAVRWALSDLVNTSAARTHLKTTWTGGSGKLPASLVLQDCRTEAFKLIDQFRQDIGTITGDRFEESLAIYQQQFARSEFWEQRQYLIWFHGKDIQKAMQIQEPDYISIKRFFDWAITQLDITQHSDLVELRTRIEQL
ncbi:MAG: hypothetical protein AB4352_13140 [Hormoscilla sp.]